MAKYHLLKLLMYLLNELIRFFSLHYTGHWLMHVSYITSCYTRIRTLLGWRGKGRGCRWCSYISTCGRKGQLQWYRWHANWQ